MSVGDVVQVLALQNSPATVTLASAPTFGNTLVLFRAKRDTATLDAPATGGWTELPEGDMYNGADGANIYYRPVGAGESATIDIATLTQTSVGAVVEVVGALTLAGHGETTGTGSPHTCPTVTPTAGQAGVIFGFVVNRAGDAVGTFFTPAAGWTERLDLTSPDGHPQCTLISKTVASTSGNYTPSATSTIGGDWAAQTAAFLVSTPPSDDPPIVVVINSETGSIVGNIDDAQELRFRDELQGVGSGSFKIARNSPNATEAILAQGNFVQITVPRISPNPIFGFFIEPSDVTIASTDEDGGELMTVSGRGPLSYLERGVILESSLAGSPAIPPGGVVTNVTTGTLPGQHLARLVAEFKHPSREVHPTALMTSDFDYTLDSDGNAWADPGSSVVLGYVGDNGLAILALILGAGSIEVLMSPTLLLRAFNSYGRDLHSATFAAGKVRFAKGVNIADTLQRQTGGELPPNWALVSGDDDTYAHVTIATAKPARETFIRTAGTGSTMLTGIGTADLNRRLRRNESIGFPVAVGKFGSENETTGAYLPGPPGTSGHFWKGDTVTVHTGSGAWDLNNKQARIQAVVIWFDDANNLFCSIEAAAVFRNSGRVVQVGAMGRGVSTAGSDGGGLPATVPPPDGNAVVLSGGYLKRTTADTLYAPLDHLTDPTDAHDASAISILDTANWYDAAHVEAALKEIGAVVIGYQAHGNTGSTETFDSSLAGWHTATLDANCTFTFAGAFSGRVASLVLELTQDGAGSRIVTWPGAVAWASGSAPTLSTTPAATDILVFYSHDGGVSWIGLPVGGAGAGSALTIKDEGSSLATAATSIDFVGAGVVASGTGAAKTVTIPGGSGGIGPLLISDTPSTPLVFADLIQNEAQDDLVYADP